MSVQFPANSIRFTNPPANPGRYDRRGRFHHYDAPPIRFTATMKSGGMVRARIVLLRGREREIIAVGEWSQGPDYEMVLEELPPDWSPLDPLVISAEVDAPPLTVWPMARPISIGPPPPATTPRWIATASQPMRYGALSYGGVGYVWWPGKKPAVRSTPYAPRPGGPWPENPTPDDWYVQRMTPCGGTGDFYPEFLLHDSGHIAAHFAETQYRPKSSHAPGGLRTGVFHDGPRDVGSVGFPVGGFVDIDGAAIIACAPGRIVRVDLTGAVETLAGWRIRESGLAQIGGTGEVPADFEYVGEAPESQRWMHIWDVCADPDDPSSLYVANTDGQCITRVDWITGAQTVFAGAHGQAGFADGFGPDARFRNPRGVTVRDGVLYVGDALNHAIRMVDLETLEVTTLVQSADMHEHTLAHSAGYDGAREWARDGEFGFARFMHPLHVRFAPDGALLAVLHHQAQVLEFDLETRQVKTLCDIPTSRWGDQMRSWQTLSVGPDGKIYTAGWEHGTDAVFTRQGEPQPGLHYRTDRFNSAMNAPRVRESTGYDVSMAHVQKNGYSQLVLAGADGSIWWGGVAGFGLQRITPRRETDPPPVDFDRFSRGRDLWRRSPHPHRPALSLLHGPWGTNGYGLENVDDFGGWDFAGFRDFVRADHGFTVAEMSDDEIADVHYFIQRESITWKGFDLTADPIPPLEPEEPEPEPEPEEPDLEEPLPPVTEDPAMGIDITYFTSERPGSDAGGTLEPSKWVARIWCDVERDGSLIVLQIGGRSASGPIVPGTGDHGIPDLPLWQGHKLELVHRYHSGGDDPEHWWGGKGGRSVATYVLRDAPAGSGVIEWEVGREFMSQNNASGRQRQAVWVLHGDIDMSDPIAAVAGNASRDVKGEGFLETQVGLEIPTIQGAMIFDCCCTRYHYPEPIPERDIYWREQMGGSGNVVHVSGSILTGTGEPMQIGWRHPDGTAAPWAQMAIVIRPLGASVEPPPPEEEEPAPEPDPEPEEHPAAQKLRDARELIDSALDDL